jgi:mediator of RNA polymerase II transcription subunit 12
MFASKSTLGNRPSAKAQSSREELVNKRYNLVEPTGVHPLDGANNNLKFPDFQPWKHSPREDLIAVNHLQRGYFESPQVGNELLSARNIMHQLLRTKNSLDELSSNLLKSFDMRSMNNKVGPGSYKPPPRVTLTDQKREAWLKDLANDEVPLRKLARTIPHGVRNKTLIEQCISKKIPVNRAIWFVRCVSTNELRGLKRKGGANIEYTWIQEWTTQVVEFIEKLSHDYLKFETFQQAKESWKVNMNYMLRFASNLFIENLIERETFKSWILTFFKSCKVFELPLSLTIVKMFWMEILKTDFIVKELTEGMIQRYEQVSSCKNVLESKEITITDHELNESIKTKIMEQMKGLLIGSFEKSNDNFILPNNWEQLCPTVKSVLNLDDPIVKRKFDLINYRNESLMINYSLNKSHAMKDIIAELDSCDTQIEYKAIISLILKEDWRQNLKLLIQWALTKYRYSSYRIYLCAELAKRLKNNPSIPLKDLEQEILNIVFELPENRDDLRLQDVFVLLNELSQVKLFKAPIYMRRLISSGLIYQSDNKEEKTMHASILKNLRPQKGSQAALILKNLADVNECNVNYEEKLKFGMEILEAGMDTFADTQALESLEVGLKLQLSEIYLSKILSRENLFPLITYKEFERILKAFTSLGDIRGCCKVIISALESQSLERQELMLVSEWMLAHSKLVNILTNIETVLLAMLQNSTRLRLGTSMKSFWDHFARSSNKYSEDIDQILKTNELEYDLATVMISLADSELKITYEELLLEANFHNNFQVLIRTLFNNTSDDNKIKNTLTLLKILQLCNPTEFNRVLFVHIKKTYSSSTELFKYEPLLELIIAGLLSIQMTVETFMGFNSQLHFSFIQDLLFKEPIHSYSCDWFKLAILRDRFKHDNYEILLNLVKRSLSEKEQTRVDTIQSDSAEIISSLMSYTTSNTYNNEQRNLFLEILTSHQKMVIASIEFEDEAFKGKVITWLDEIIVSRSRDLDTEQGTTTQLVEYIKRVNRFNLPIVQLLFKLVLRPDIGEADLLSILKIVVCDMSERKKIMGSIFELLDTSLKIRLIHFLESMFLSSPTFPCVSVDDNALDLGPLTDTLVTLSLGTQNINLPDELVFCLDGSLVTLIKVLSQPDRDNDDLYAAISLFLKIIIIHKPFLINILTERNTIKENFLNNLVNLLTTKLVSQNLQLKNLLYDLLLSIKSSINELNSNQKNNVKLPVSIVSLPNISKPVGKAEPPLQNRQNLHDISVVNNLYLYLKTTSSFHEFSIKPFDMVEDSNPIETLNDTAISLQLFETSIERKNPT